MKVRLGLVTNPSSSCFVAIKIKSNRLRSILHLHSANELNERLQNSVDSIIAAYDCAFFPFPGEFEGYYDECELTRDKANAENSVSGYLLSLLGNEDFMDEDPDQISITDGDIEFSEIDIAQLADGGYGPFEYIRINNGKKLTIRAEETSDDRYKNEDLLGYEFSFIGESNEFEDKDSMCEYIINHGGTISDTVSDKTRYVVCADLDTYNDQLNAVRNMCIPVLSQKAFKYRYSDLSYDIYNAAFEMIDYQSVLLWFEEYGLGETKIEYWKDNKWQ